MRRFYYLASLLVVLGTTVCLIPQKIYAQSTSDNGLSLQVTPSPIVETISPGDTKTVELRIRNTGQQPEELRMGLQSFEVDSQSGEIRLLEDEPRAVKDWVSFENASFSVDAGQWFTQNITFKVPPDAGFTYNFAITISRQPSENQEPGASVIEGRVAIFTLLSINRPDAVRSLKIERVEVEQRTYSFLPVQFRITLRNDGNTLIQPRGNVFIQRSANDIAPLSVLELNPNDSFVLPDSSRTFTVTWSDGFPLYENSTNPNTGQTTQTLTWDWENADSFRLGRYTAKVIALYDNGQRDVPLETSVSFWVIPWLLIISCLLLGALLAVGIITVIKKLITVIRRRK